MKHQFKFDKRTGTMMPAQDDAPAPNNGVPVNEIEEGKPNQSAGAPVFKEQKRIVTKNNSVNVGQNQVVKMQRTDKPTPVQLVNEDGLPEAYLDSITTGILMFRERQDYDICQITDEKTGKVLAYIGGYGLAFNFNMSELRNMERIEQCLQGLMKLFRHKIMTQYLGEGSLEK